VTWLGALCLGTYGEFTDLRLDFGEHLTVVYGTNEAGKSTAHDALADFLWGIPLRSNRASSFARAKLVLEGDVHVGSETVRCVRRATGLVDQAGSPLGPGPWNPDNDFDGGMRDSGSTTRPSGPGERQSWQPPRERRTSRT